MPWTRQQGATYILHRQEMAAGALVGLPLQNGRCQCLNAQLSQWPKLHHSKGKCGYNAKKHLAVSQPMHSIKNPSFLVGAHCCHIKRTGQTFHKLEQCQAHRPGQPAHTGYCTPGPGTGWMHTTAAIINWELVLGMASFHGSRRCLAASAKCRFWKIPPLHLRHKLWS